MKSSGAFRFIVAVVLLQTVGGAPVAKPEIKNEPIQHGDVTVVFISSCTGSGNKHEVNLPKEENNRCVEVSLASTQIFIKTEPNGLRLRLFSEEACQGKSELYDSSSQSTSQGQLPFKVASFIIDRAGK